MIRYHLLTFGCQMNVRDSQWLAAALEERGFVRSSLESADICLLNTCSVREKPEIRIKEAIRRLTAQRPQAIIGVLGCVAQQLGEELFASSPHVRLVAGSDGISLVPEALESLRAYPNSKISLLEFSDSFPERTHEKEECPQGHAFVSIMQGCDNFCSYCIVPFTRGRQKSRPRQAILRECGEWVRKGAVELCLLGQNVNVWGGKGKTADEQFSSLLREIAAIPGLERLRFHTSHPADMGPRVIEALAELPQICPRLHLPLQSGSDAILKAMRRRHTREQYLELVKKIRAVRPDMELSTDLIVGFPQETEADFLQTLEMIRECRFISSFSFCYSDRPGTRAALMPGKIDLKEKLRRLKNLQEVQDGLTSMILDSHIGQQTSILLEKRSPKGGENSWQGKDPYGITINISMPQNMDYQGRLVTARITGAKKHTLTASLISICS